MRTNYLIKDIASIKNGSTPSTSDESNYDGDIVWITPKDLSNQKSKYIWKGERNISQKGYSSCSTTLLPKGTILLSSRAPIGLLSISKVELCTNQGFKNIVVNDKVNNEYLYYLLKTKIKEIEGLGSGTTFKEVSKTTLENFSLMMEDDTTKQQSIAKVLSTIDDKIELNNKINKELEQMAKILYDYWFVQFEFPAGIKGAYKSVKNWFSSIYNKLSRTNTALCQIGGAV